MGYRQKPSSKNAPESRDNSSVHHFGARAGNRTRVEASTTPHDNRYTTRAASRRVTTAI